MKSPAGLHTHSDRPEAGRGPDENGSPPGGEFCIRRASEPDLPAVRELADVIWRECYPAFLPPGQIDYMLARMYELETMRDEVRSQGICYELVETAGELVGFAAHGPTPEPGVYQLHKLYLHPRFHGRGFGSRLLRHCEGEVRKLGAVRLILRVNRNNRKAIDAYRRNGYNIVEPAVTDIGGGFVMDDFVMAKALARGE